MYVYKYAHISYICTSTNEFPKKKFQKPCFPLFSLKRKDRPQPRLQFYYISSSNKCCNIKNKIKCSIFVHFNEGFLYHDTS